MVGAQPLHLFAKQLEAHAADGALARVQSELSPLQGLFERFIEESARWTTGPAG
jgi:hypothetical protein